MLKFLLLFCFICFPLFVLAKGHREVKPVISASPSITSSPVVSKTPVGKFSDFSY